MRERSDGGRHAVDGAVADLLGHHQRIHELLFHRNLPRLLPLGVRLAAAQHRRGEPHRALRPAFPARAELRRALCVGGGQYGAFPPLLLVHAVEEYEGGEEKEGGVNIMF